METAIFKITDGIRCEKCANRLTGLLQNIVGVREAIVSFDKATAQIRFNPRAVNLDDVAAVFKKGGFEVLAAKPASEYYPRCTPLKMEKPVGDGT